MAMQSVSKAEPAPLCTYLPLQGRMHCSYFWSSWVTLAAQKYLYSPLISNILCLFFSWFRALAVRRVHGWAGLAHTPTYVQPAKNSGDLLLQHGPHQAAVVQDLGGDRRPFQQGGWGMVSPIRLDTQKQKHIVGVIMLDKKCCLNSFNYWLFTHP